MLKLKDFALFKSRPKVLLIGSTSLCDGLYQVLKKDALDISVSTTRTGSLLQRLSGWLRRGRRRDFP